MSKRVALAFSGGLDTCWCIPVLQKEGFEVLTVTTDLGGFSETDLHELETRSQALGSERHETINAKGEYFDQVLKYLVFGNILRGNTYPLCVGAERALQAKQTAEFARRFNCQYIAHGSTAAGNDQVRFEVALRSYAPNLAILAPVRDRAPQRAAQRSELLTSGLDLPEKSADYSVNSGLWGVTIGGKEINDTSRAIPEHAWQRTKEAFSNPKPATRVEIGFEQGVPVSLFSKKYGPAELIEELDRIAGPLGIGRGIHIGETILGIKGRIAFEAPAAHVLIAAHRELEKLVLTKRQIAAKDITASLYGEYVHEGLLTDPVCRDIEAQFARSQDRVTGTVWVTLRPGSILVDGVESAWSLHAASRSVYGEQAAEWSPEDAKGFSRIHGLSAVLHARLGGES